MCNRRVIESLLYPIELVYEEVTFKIPMKTLFEDLLDSTFLSTFCVKEKKDNTFILGFPFIKLFNYSLFDYESNQIKFYSSDIPIIVNINRKKVYCSVIITILVFNIVLLLVRKNNIKLKFNKPDLYNKISL